MKSWNKIETTSKRLQEAMRITKLKQADLAKILGVSETAISNYEKGRRTPPIHLLKTYAEALDVYVEDLIDLIVVAKAK